MSEAAAGEDLVQPHTQTHAFSRADRTRVGEWWWTVDHWLLGATLALIGLGVLLRAGALRRR